jgi:hypothetical protein
MHVDLTTTGTDAPLCLEQHIHPLTVTVTATSQADPSKSASAIVTLFPPVTIGISPAAATLYGGQQQAFSATVTNTFNNGRYLVDQFWRRGVDQCVGCVHGTCKCFGAADGDGDRHKSGGSKQVRIRNCDSIAQLHDQWL